MQKLLNIESDCEAYVLDIIIIRNRLPSVIYDTGDITLMTEMEVMMERAKPRTIFHIASPDSMVISSALFEFAIVNQNLLAAVVESSKQILM